VRCSLGKKKIRRIEELLGKKVKGATVRGGNPHFWAWVHCVDGTVYFMNYITGEKYTEKELSSLDNSEREKYAGYLRQLVEILNQPTKQGEYVRNLTRPTE